MNTFIIICFVLISGVLAYYLYTKVNPTKKSDIKELYAEGLDMLVSGKKYSAYNNFKEIISKDSNNVMAYLRLGQILRENGDNLKAIKIHKNLLLRKKLSSYELIELHKNLSKDYYNVDNTAQSIDECKKILEIDKKNEWAIKEIIKLYKENNKWVEAEKYLNLYYKEFPDRKNNQKIALYKTHQAIEFIKEKNYKEARLNLDASLALDSENSLTYFFIAKTYSEESNLIYDKAMSIENDGLDKYNNQQEYNDFIKLAKETLSKSIPLWTHFCEISPNKSWVVLPLLKDALFALDRYSELEEILSKLNEKFPENIEILLSLADYYSHKGEYDKSIEIIDKAIDKDKNSYLAKLVDIKLRLEKDNNDQLSKKLDELINSLTKNERFQILNTSNDYSIMKLFFDDNDK